MDSGPIVPLVEQGLGGLSPYASSMALTQGATGAFPEVKNYAGDPDVVQQVQGEILPVIDFTRATRMSLEEEWRAIRRCEYLLHDEGRKYFGRSDAYLPAFNRNSQLLTSRLARGLFPSDEYMDVTLRGPGDPEQAKPLKTYLQWEFEENADLRGAIKPFLRQFVNYGNAVLKTWYKKEIQSEGKLKRVPDAMAGFRGEAGFGRAFHDGLAVQARSIFSVYFHPVTAATVNDLTMIFEDIVVPRGYARDMVRKGKWLGVAKGDAPPTQPIPNMTTDMADQITNMTGITAPISGLLGGKDIGEMLPITEVWTYMKLPKSAYVDGEDPEEAVPVRLVVSGSLVMEVTRNPFYHQRPPYLVGRANVQPGLFYGYGFGRVSRSLQYLANDFVNQTNDCGVLAMNPIAVINPGAIAGPLRPYAPGATWYLTDPQNGVQFIHPPVETMSAGLEMLKATTGMLQDFGGAPPIMQGQAAGGTARTATGGQMLQANAQMPLQDLVEDIENQVMVPLMRMAVKLGQQYCPPQIMAEVAGEPVVINQSDLAVDATFRWLASSQTANSQQRAQQAVQMLQAVMPLMPLLMQLGYQVDPVPLLKKIYADALGYRGFAEFIRKAIMPPGPGMQPQGAPGITPPQPGSPDGDRVRSALEQIFGKDGAPDMQEGEGEEFMNVRSQADHLAAISGARG